jgi:hypothetical protein
VRSVKSHLYFPFGYPALGALKSPSSVDMTKNRFFGNSLRAVLPERVKLIVLAEEWDVGAD